MAVIGDIIIQKRGPFASTNKGLIVTIYVKVFVELLLVRKHVAS